MSYDYETQKPRLFTEDGLALFVEVRDDAHRLLKDAGAFTAGKILNRTGDAWDILACLDLMVERAEIRLVFDRGRVQDSVFTKAHP